ncbi:MAG: tRNA (N6-threonylcarbamoyladenosine(37)-N6)-methyltransferase TrmO [Catonella sp.]|nr:tRNA (N6-threonylcarbamoyladenosine(37)-N6)-methyltransferase TrmO [Catonella sp.]
MEISPIAHIFTEFSDKFGIPRQSGLAKDTIGRIVFEPEYRNPDALKGLDGFSHIWLIWEFTECHTDEFKASVRPPRLPNNSHMGVFATRSPYRPNALGLSSVEIADISPDSDEGPIIYVKGADILSGTPIYDIKPYLPYADCHIDAKGGFAENVGDYRLKVHFPDDYLSRIPEENRSAAVEVLAEDSRPSYAKNDPEKVYGLTFAGHNIKFSVNYKDLYVVDVF